MIDGIKLLDLSVSADALLLNSRLLFPLSLDEQTGAVLDRPRRADDQGLTFTLTPTKAGDRIRCELQGSLHRYHNAGRHNADQFTAADLLATLDDLVRTFGINPFRSRLNNVEFGVNVRLPFPVDQVLNNLISYKYRPFNREPGDGFSYYQCLTQRYAVKLYDKGDQYRATVPGLPANVLRVEVKVLKMEYLTRRGVNLNVLADLVSMTNYGPLGSLLVETFTEILFDEPTVNPAALPIRERDVYQNGRNPRFWSIPDDLTGKEYERHRKALQRTEKVFRALLDQHRRGNDWQRETAALIGQTWTRLTTVDAGLLLQIGGHRAAWWSLLKLRVEPTDADRETVEECPKLTGSDADLLTGQMSQINPLSIVLIRDNAGTGETDQTASRETLSVPPAGGGLSDCERSSTAGPPARVLSSSSSSSSIDQANAGRPTASVLRADAALLAKAVQSRKRYANGSKENEFERAAHNLRNDDSNPRNNLARRLRRLLDTPAARPLPLFSPAEVIRLTPDQRAALDHWRGTPYEVRL